MSKFFHLRDMVGSIKEWLCQNLSRVTSTGVFLPEIDGLRFIAILAVVLHHMVGQFLLFSHRIAEPFSWTEAAKLSPIVEILEKGDLGVKLFFVISGFILCYPFAKAYCGRGTSPELSKYFLRRISRLEPPFIIALCLVSLLRLLTGSFPEWQRFVASLFYSHSFIYGETSRISMVLWSLEVEVQFYCIAPLIARVFLIPNATLRRLLLVLAVISASFFSSAFVAQWGIRWQLSLGNFLQYFLAGFILVEIYLSADGWGERGWWWDGGALIAGGLILAGGTTGLPFLILAFYIGLLRGRVGYFLLSHRAITITGGMCYTIYMYHVFLMSIFCRLLPQSGFVGMPLAPAFFLFAVLCGFFVLAGSAVPFILFERPCMVREWYKKPLRSLFPFLSKK